MKRRRPLLFCFGIQMPKPRLLDQLIIITLTDHVVADSWLFSFIFPPGMKRCQKVGVELLPYSLWTCILTSTLFYLYITGFNKILILLVIVCITIFTIDLDAISSILEHLLLQCSNYSLIGEAVCAIAFVAGVVVVWINLMIFENGVMSF